MNNLYKFLQDRDAKIVELFFLALNVYIFILLVTPPYSRTGFNLFIRIVFQITITICNMLSLRGKNRLIRTISSVANASVMGLISTALLYTNNPQAGVYGLLCLLAIFVCWKIQLK